MRKPSEYIPAAMAKLRRSLIPDCSEVLRHGGRSAEVTRVGSVSKGGDSVTDSDVNENVRVLADAADFPELAKGCLVTLSDTWRIVVSATTDPARASLVVGMSAALDTIRAAYRRPGTKIAFPVDVLAVEGDELEPDGNAYAPTFSRVWHVAVSADSWDEPTEPQVGDTLELDGANLRVASVSKRDGFWILTARARR